MLKNRRRWAYLFTLLLANLLLGLPAAHPIRVGAALLLIGYLPGWSWATFLFPATPPLFRWSNVAGLSLVISLMVTLLLHYLPGPVGLGPLLAGLNAAGLLPLLLFPKRSLAPTPPPQLAAGEAPDASPAVARWLPAGIGRPLIPLAAILLVGLLLRASNLGYSEFQGDEALAMISAAEALEGHEDALFLRSKGPAEVLLPAALWRLSGVITEAGARLPFLGAIMLALVTLFQIGDTLGRALARRDVAWLAALFFGLNGFTVAFGRIVQYQALVLWLSSLAFLMLLAWRQSRQQHLAGCAGLYLGAGLLAHYDAILVVPALLWLLLGPALQRKWPERRVWPDIRATLLFAGGLVAVALPFYLPFSLDPQANRTGDYVGGRIGNELRNNLPDFFHFNTFYSSFYGLLFTGLLVFGLLLWWLGRGNRGRAWLRYLLGLFIVAVIWRPGLLVLAGRDLSLLPFVGLVVAVFLLLVRQKEALSHQALLAWLAVPFLGYNFVVALGLTHIYTIVPAWSLLAALAGSELHLALSQGRFSLAGWGRRLSGGVVALFSLLSLLYLGNAFVRRDVEYFQDYPAGRLALFWSPYQEPPQAGLFGFAHRSGWKAIGQKIAGGELAGDYGSNEEPDVTTWYTRGAPRACDPRPEYYFLADDLVDRVEAPAEVLQAHYAQIGQVTLPNRKQLRIMQQKPTSLALGSLAEAELAAAFDAGAWPAAFARSGRGAVARPANFANLVQLIGYNLDTRRARPGGRVPVTLFWQALAPIPASYHVFTHLEVEVGGGVVAQADGVPVCWQYPTEVWRPGQIIADQHAIAIPPETRPAAYSLQIGLYAADTLTRLDILDEAGNPAGTSLTLTTVEIKP